MGRTDRFYEKLKKRAWRASRQAVEVIGINDTVPIHVRCRIDKKLRKEMLALLIDRELGEISGTQFAEAAKILKIIYRSL